MQKCYKCNLQFQDDRVHFCPYCGSALAVDREWKEEQERKRLEEEKRKEIERLWNEKVEIVDNRARQARHDLYDYHGEAYQFTYRKMERILENYNFRFTKPSSEEQLKKYSDNVRKVEDFCTALKKGINSSNFTYFKEILKSNLCIINDTYSRLLLNPKATTRIKEFLKGFLKGGKILWLKQGSEMEKDDLSESQINGTKFTPEEISLTAIPYTDRKKYNVRDECDFSDYEYVKIKYYRYKIYKSNHYLMEYINFGSVGMEKLVNDLSQYSSDVNDKFLQYYDDINIVIDFVNQINDNIRNYIEPKFGVIEDVMKKTKLRIAKMEYESKDDPYTFKGYAYYHHVTERGPQRKRW